MDTNPLAGSAAGHGASPETPPSELWRPIFLDEAVRILADATDLAPQVILADRTLIIALEQALDDPQALHQGPPGLSRLARNAAELVERLLQAGVPAPVVSEIVGKTVRRSLAAWDPGAGPRLIARYAASSDGPDELATTILPLLRPSRRLRSHLEAAYDWSEQLAQATALPQCRLLDTRPYNPDRRTRRGVPTLYLGHPRAHLNTLAEPSVELESLRYDVQRALTVVLSILPAPICVRLCEPCRHNQAHQDADLIDIVDLAIASSDAYLYAGVAGYALGAGGMYELQRFAGRYGPIAIAQPSDCPHSPREVGVLDNAMRVTIAQDNLPLATFTATWFAENYEEILSAHRRRHNRRLLSSPQRDTALALVKRSSNRRITDALAASGLSLRQLSQLLSDSDTTSIPWQQLNLFLERLSVATRRRQPGPSHQAA